MSMLKQSRSVLGSHSVAVATSRSLRASVPAPRSCWNRGCDLTRFGRHSRRAVVESAAKDADKLSEEKEEQEFEDLDSPDDASALTTQQVQSLLNVVCEETEIAEIELKIGDFGLKVRRKMSDFASPASAVSSNGAGYQPTSANELPFQSTASIDEAQVLQQPSRSNAASVDEEDWIEENLLYLGAPKVGILRRGRYMKGKKIGKGPVADVGTKVKKGQPVAFIEQLGTFVPVEAPQAGEIVAFAVDEGTSVEYKEVIVEIAPFFGGHIIGDKKYA